MPLSEIVEVTITRETAAVSQAGFGTPMIAGPSLKSASRLEYVSSTTEAAAVLYGGSDAPEYDFIAAVFSQNPRPTRAAIGLISGTKAFADYDNATPPVLGNGTWTAGSAVVTVNGTETTVPFDTDKATSLAAVATAIQAHADVTTAVYAANVITVTPATGTPVSVTIDLSAITGTLVLVASATATEDVTDALDAILAAQSDWYGLGMASRVQQDQLDAAAWALANEKLSFFADDDTDIANTTDAADTTTLAALLKANSNDRAVLAYNETADGSSSDQRADGAAAGMILGRDPGAYTAKFKKLTGVTVSNLTPTQSTNIRAKNANSFEEIGGVNIFREGTTSEGEFIDVMHFVDWLKARITENVYQLLVSQAKVPYTDGGILSIRSRVEEILQVGQDRGGISPTAFDDDDVQIGGFYTEVPALADIPANDKANRVLNDVKFTAFLAGAIHKVVIDGIVTL